MDYCGVCGQKAAFRCVDCGALRCKPDISTAHPVKHPTANHLTVKVQGKFNVILAPHLGYIGQLPVRAEGRCENCLRQQALQLSGRLNVLGMDSAADFLTAGRLIDLFAIQFEANPWFASMDGWRSGFGTPERLLSAVAASRSPGQPWQAAAIRGGERSIQVLDVPHRVGNWEDGYTPLPWGVQGPLAVTESGQAVRPAGRPAFSFAPRDTKFYEPIGPRALDSALTGQEEYTLLASLSNLDRDHRPTRLCVA